MCYQYFHLKCNSHYLMRTNVYSQGEVTQFGKALPSGKIMQLPRLHTLAGIVSGMDAVSRQRDVLVLVIHCFQEGDQVLVVGELLGHREGHHHHVDGCLAFSQSPEERWDWSVELLHCALGSGWCVAVVLGVAHACKVTHALMSDLGNASI